MSKHKFLFKHSDFYNSSRLSSVATGIGKHINEQNDLESQPTDIGSNGSFSAQDFASASKYEDNLPNVTGERETCPSTVNLTSSQLESNDPDHQTDPTTDFGLFSFLDPPAKTAHYVTPDQAELVPSTSLHLTRIGDGQMPTPESQRIPCSTSHTTAFDWSDDYSAASQQPLGFYDRVTSEVAEDVIPACPNIISLATQQISRSQDVQRSIPTGVITRAPPVRAKAIESEEEVNEAPDLNLKSPEGLRRGPKRKWSLKNIIEHPGTPVVYECKVCQKKFRNKNNCKYHQHKDAVFHYTCDLCGKGMMAKTHYEYHMKKHKGAREFGCRECTKTFITSNDLARHQQIHQQNVVKTLHKCSACPRTFHTEALLRRHTAVHNDEQRVTCQKCNTQFASFAELRDHGRVAHSDSKKFKCNVCSLGFERQKHLDDHSTIHTRERAHECPHCPRRFRTERSLNTHKMNHEGDRPYKCGKCNRRFLLQKDCLRHESVHNDEKPFGCDLCDKSFRRSDNLQRHVRLHHGEDDVLGLDAAELVQGMIGM